MICKYCKGSGVAIDMPCPCCKGLGVIIQVMRIVKGEKRGTLKLVRGEEE